MVADRPPLERATLAGQELGNRRLLDPIRYTRWLPLQFAFLCSGRTVKQIRAGNQTIGKTWCALAEVIGRCRGEHPLSDRWAGWAAYRAMGLEVPLLPRYRQPPVEWWVVCASWSQSLGIQKKLAALLPWAELTERTSYDAVAGFAPTKSPVIEFRNGSIIRIKTTGQDAIDFAGATIDCVLFDEPPKQPRMYTEALMRLEELGGTLLLSYTPINAPTDYLRALVNAGQIEDHWRPLTPAEFIPVGCTEPLLAKDGRPKDAHWIAERRAKVPEHEQAVVVDGEWEGRAVGAYYSPVFRADVHVRDVPLKGRWRLLLGLDHGHQPGKQCAVLVLARREGQHWQVYVLDEYVDHTGVARPEDDARAILQMLRRHGWDWHNLDEARGDRIHMKGTDSEKSNEDLMVHLSLLLEMRSPRLLKPQIDTAKQGSGHLQGSVKAGSRWLYHAMARPGGFHLHPRCLHGRAAIERYVEKDDEYGSKDWLDACRYALDGLIFERGGGDPGATVRFG
jgi:hypothetical protein